LSSALYTGFVRHQRLRPRTHSLRYRVFNLLLDLDTLPETARRLRLFAHNRRGLFSFHDADHGEGEPSLRPWVDRQLARAGIDLEGGPIRLLCMPRILGHAFNPISVFFCHRRDGALAAILYQVNNTFGQRHSYLLPVADPTPPIRQDCAKGFYVSPFMPMDMRYRFTVVPPGGTVAIGVDGLDAEGPLILTSFQGRRVELTDRALLGAFLRMPLLGLKVVVGIHWEALKLWRKGLRLQPRPPAPAELVSLP
jgi:DUF1365 family protein